MTGASVPSDSGLPGLHPGDATIPVDASASEDPAQRSLFEFILVLLMATIIFKTFVVDGYFVPTGSMAPHLLGVHQNFRCPRCQQTCQVGYDRDAWSPPSLACPHCKRGEITTGDPAPQPGDRLLVLKGLYDLRPPSRWESVVFLNPNDVGEAYVKRVAGLPGERISVRSGDIYINGTIARKSFAQFLALALTVYSDAPLSAEQARDFWVEEGATSLWQRTHAGWRTNAPTEGSLEFQDIDQRGEPETLRDEIAYNSMRLGPSPPNITDFGVLFDLQIDKPEGELRISLYPAAHESIEFVIDPVRSQLAVHHRGRVVKRVPITLSPGSGHPFAIAFWDARVGVRVEGQTIVEIDLEPIPAGNDPTIHPVRLTSQGFQGTISNIQIVRDLYYRTATHFGPQTDDAGFQLGPDEFFMLGDNSAISNDSRSWQIPGIPRRLLLGKPVLVHLPMWTWRGKILGRTFAWDLPDWSRIRRVDPW